MPVLSRVVAVPGPRVLLRVSISGVWAPRVWLPRWRRAHAEGSVLPGACPGVLEGSCGCTGRARAWSYSGGFLSVPPRRSQNELRECEAPLLGLAFSECEACPPRGLWCVSLSRPIFHTCLVGSFSVSALSCFSGQGLWHPVSVCSVPYSIGTVLLPFAHPPGGGALCGYRVFGQHHVRALPVSPLTAIPSFTTVGRGAPTGSGGAWRAEPHVDLPVVSFGRAWSWSTRSLTGRQNWACPRVVASAPGSQWGSHPGCLAPCCRDACWLDKACSLLGTL